MANRFVSPDQQFISFAGLPYAGGQLFFYVSGTNTPANTYSDSGLTIPNTNPVILDSAGNGGNIFLTSSVTYKVVLEDANNNQIWTFDPVIPTDFTGPTFNPVISCTASGTNTLLLTPLTASQQPSVYSNYILFAFVAPNTATGNLTAQVGSLSSYPVYISPGVRAAANSVVSGGGPYLLAYGSFVAGSSPGFLLVNPNLQAGFGLAASGGNLQINTTNPPYGFDVPINMGISASVGANALTINLTTAAGTTPTAANPVVAPFRSPTLTSGAPVWASISSALSIVIPSSATLGTSSSNVPFRIWIFLCYNGGTPELGAAVCSTPSGTISPASAWETTLKTTITIGAGATSSGVLYATAGVASDSVRIIGYAEYGTGLATAGTWASGPTALQLMGPGVKKPGDVVQTVPNSTTTAGTTSSSTFAALATGQSQAIIPTSSANLIRISMQGTLDFSTSVRAFLQLARGSTLIGNPAEFFLSATVSEQASPVFLLVYDAPGSAASVTYNVYGKIASAQTLTYPAANTGSIMEFQEIMG